MSCVVTAYYSIQKTIFFIALFIFAVKGFGQIPSSGLYGDLILFRNNDNHTIDGYFKSSTSDGRFTCLFEFKGTYKNLSDKLINVTALWPDDEMTREGLLICISNNSFVLKFNESLPGSMACSGVDSETGSEFELQKNKEWLGIKIVKSERAYFFKEPIDETKCKAYITKYDAVGIIERKNDWLLVEYYGLKLTLGWIKLTDFY